MGNILSKIVAGLLAGVAFAIVGFAVVSFLALIGALFPLLVLSLVYVPVLSTLTYWQWWALIALVLYVVGIVNSRSEASK